jgi:hypothetical protein
MQATLPSWGVDWAWSLPLTVLTLVIHVLGLGLINKRVIALLELVVKHRHFTGAFVLGMGATVLLATVLHGFEATIWAVAYRLLGAIGDNKSAILYSLGAITTYGHATLFLEDRWQLMGALEALNGLLLFGLTTAFLFGMIQRVWPMDRR